MRQPNLTMTCIWHHCLQISATKPPKMTDFIDLANAHRYLLERILNDEDDDFAKIENDHHTTQQYTYPPQTAANAYVASTPVLSKSAEAELYLLATNFLLCKSHLYLLPFAETTLVTLCAESALITPGTEMDPYLAHGLFLSPHYRRCHGNYYHHGRQNILSRISETWSHRRNSQSTIFVSEETIQGR